MISDRDIKEIKQRISRQDKTIDFLYTTMQSLEKQQIKILEAELGRKLTIAETEKISAFSGGLRRNKHDNRPIFYGKCKKQKGDNHRAPIKRR